MEKIFTDYLVIGSGLAGLAFALKVADQASVVVISKDEATSNNSSWAQGGIAAVMSDEDSFNSHISDTLRAGAGLCRESTVASVVRQAPERIEDLVKWGVHFDVKDSSHEPDLTREGGHSFRRILHFEDHTGAEIQRALIDKCRAHRNIQFLTHHMAVDLILNKFVAPLDFHPTRCIGAYILNRKTGDVITAMGKQVVLSTGGAGKVYLYTTNWSGATGDGIAMAYRAGARVANLEFMQFHPTCLYHPDSRNFLISEALRGEGGELVNAQGEAFVKKYHSMGSLAPRDIVARAIDAEMKRSGAACVFLDMTKHSRNFLQTRFPVIFKRCLDYGIDMSTTPIPVVPAAHYLCGGILTDVNGQTDIDGLWALGETACTGLHGANRLASNSLLECLTMAHNCAEKTLPDIKRLEHFPKSPREWVHPPENNADEMIVINHMWDEIRRLMWNYVGIVRSNKRLERAASRMKNILSEVKEYYSNFQIHSDILELRNIAIVADLSIDCALRRKESRGIHYNLDYPWVKEDAQGNVSAGEDTVIYHGRSS